MTFSCKFKAIGLISLIASAGTLQNVFAAEIISASLARQVLDQVDVAAPDAQAFNRIGPGAVKKILKGPFRAAVDEFKVPINQVTPLWQLATALRGKPAKTHEGMLDTSNNMGVEIDDIRSPFFQVVFSKVRANDTVLDVGAAYGFLAQQLLAKRARVIALDMDPSHLAELVRTTPLDHLDRLQIVLGSFPEDLDQPEHSLDHVVMGQVIHFMTPTQIEGSFKKAHQMLKPSGSFSVMANTIYGSLFNKPNTRAALETAIQETNTRLSKETVEEFLFPSYLPNLGLGMPDLDNPKKKMLHPQSPTVTLHNLTVAGFTAIHYGAFSTLFSDGIIPKVHFYDMSNKGLNNIFFYYQCSRN